MYRNKYTPNRNQQSGRYQPIEGKTQKMLDQEKSLGVEFEKDYKENYINGDMTQREFAKRWNTSKTVIFDTTLRQKGRLCWLQRVGLSK